MRIAQIKISNILGIAELEFTPEGFNEISGPNGTGKTSVLEAIKSALSTGHDATLLRKGAEKGEAVLVLDDGTELSKTVTADKSTSKVRVDGKLTSRPAEAIKKLTDALSINPIDFLRARKQDRVKVLLETMPLEADLDKLAGMTGIPVTAEPGTHALSVIEVVYKEVYDDRTGTNRAVKEKDNAINQLKLAMPEAPGGVEGSEDELQAKVRSAEEEKTAELDRIAAKLTGIKKTNQQKIDEIRAEAQRQIDAIKAKAVADVEAIQTEERRIEGLAGQQREKTIQKHADTVAPLNTALESIKANRSAHAKREQAMQTIQQMEKELIDLHADVARQTKALADLDQYKADLLASLPIPGVEVKDGEIYRDGVHFDRLNTAQQVWVAVEIAKLRAGALGVCCVDGIELLDPNAFEEFRKQALESNLQLFVSRVTGDEFQVKTSQSAE
nr:MAG TPA: STRUCTURAL MAINTENANCE OF CHROMOSOMES PROTEIN [Caudoviricetes sp.]